jgi:hypothetical protein
MKVLSGVKQSGKTTKLLQEADGRDDVYVVFRKEEIADHYKKECKKNGMKVNITSINKLDGVDKQYEIWIDDFDTIIWDMFGKREIRVAVNECEVVDLNCEFANRLLKIKI